jgi:hypothetical protein
MESNGDGATGAVGGTAYSVYYRWDEQRLVPLDSLAVGSGVRRLDRVLLQPLLHDHSKLEKAE